MKIKIYFLTVFLSFWLTAFLAQNNRELKNYSVANGLPENAIVAISQDEMGYLWYATENNGIVRFDGDDFNIYNTNSGLISNKVNNLIFIKDSLFIATELGLSIKVNHQITSIKSPEVLAFYYIENTLYLVLNKGLYKLRDNKVIAVNINNEIDTNRINDIAYDGKNFWIATSKALYKIEDIQNPSNAIKMEYGNFTSLLFYESHFLVSKENEGLFLVKNDRIIKKINSFKAIFNLKKIDNELWIFSKNNGIDLVNATDFSFVRKINKYNSLKTNHTKTVFKDHLNTLWIATLDAGFYRFSNLNSKGNLNEKPRIYFENIEVVYQSIDSININNYNKELSLKPNQNHISFSFKSVALHNPKSIKYRYKLKGPFSPWTSNTSVNFANLEPGNYTFLIQAKNAEIKSEIKTFQFLVAKEFYQKPWFIGSLFGSFLFILFFIFYQKNRKTKRINKEYTAKLELQNHFIYLEQKALQLQMNPHFIFNVLNGIKALGISKNTDKFTATVSKFATLLRAILQNSSKEEINLKEEIETLKIYIELAQQMASIPFEFSFYLEVNNTDLEEILLPPMLLQPFVENAIEHAFNLKTIDPKIAISFIIKNKFLHCVIEDNGIGYFEKLSQKGTPSHQSMAINITRERIENISKYNVFTIEEIKENDCIKGTKVSFKIPLKTDY
jgi:hypothetical protein